MTVINFYRLVRAQHSRNFFPFHVRSIGIYNSLILQHGHFLGLFNTEILVSDRFRCQPGAFFGTVWKLRVMLVYKMVLQSVRRERNDLRKKENCPANKSIGQEP